jgi:hypothetical protein
MKISKYLWASMGSLFLFFILQCATIKKQPMEIARPIITLEKTGCLGKCPVYQMTIYQDHSVTFRSWANTLVDSIAASNISEQQYQHLVKAFEASDFMSLDTNYQEKIMDAPFTHLTYQNNSKSKRVSCRGDAPAIFNTLVRQTEKIAQQQGWLATSDDQGKAVSEIIIELREDTAPESLLPDLVDYGLTFIKKITPTKPYYLFSIEGDKDPKTLELVKNNPSVISAQWNHQLKKRDR